MNNSAKLWASCQSVYMIITMWHVGHCGETGQKVSMLGQNLVTIWHIETECS